MVATSNHLTMSSCLVFFVVLAVLRSTVESAKECGSSGHDLKYVWGDALTDSKDCTGPDNMQYPTAAITRNFRNLWGGNSRTGRSHQPRTIDPEVTRQSLLQNYEALQGDYSIAGNSRAGRSYSTAGTCGSQTRLCKTKYNTTAPMYGVSLTTGKAVAIVQKFPDILQQVVFEVCESKDCEVLHGECVQTFVPYLFLVLPMGEVTLTGQDYVLVESGCACKPKNPMTSPTGHQPTTEGPPIRNKNPIGGSH